MSSQITKNQVGYNHWSSFYDQYANPTMAIDDISFPVFYSALSKKNILEIGCGTGRHTARLLAADNLVTGIDISEGMLEKLKGKIKSSNLTLLNADFLTTEIPNVPFDAIIESLVLEHIPDLKAFFKKVKNLLKPRGQVFLSEIHPKRAAEGALAHFQNAQGNEITLESSAHTETDFIRFAESEGFAINEKVSVLGNAELAKQDLKWQRYMGCPMIQIWVLEVIE